MRTRHLAAIGALVFAAAAQAQAPAPANATFFKCTDAQGRTHFTDTGCGKMAAEPVTPSDTANLADRKAQNDARVARDKQLANQLEQDRVGAAAQAHSLGQTHMNADNAVASRQAAERDARNAAARSILTPSECLGCVSLGR